MINLDIYGEPIPQRRPRFSARGKFVRVYDSQTDLKEKYKWQIRTQYRDKPLTAPIFLDITFFMAIPKATSKRKKRQMLNGVCYHISRPDLDNLQKFLLDCMNEIIFMDDSQVIEIRAKKIYSEKPGTLVRIIPKEFIENYEQQNASDS